MGEEWISSENIRKQQTAAKAEDIPTCSLCQEKPDHIGKIVAGRANIFLCRDCIKDACEVLKDTGFPLE